ncbi:CHAT domain-containing protein [Micromonospora sp. NPDC047793]|uniref:CHAT domain-containing protein n=1 Tax=Micromonospora sp. NPDC047793 TaxID=3154342 RepID=UPI0033F1472B
MTEQDPFDAADRCRRQAIELISAAADTGRLAPLTEAVGLLLRAARLDPGRGGLYASDLGAAFTYQFEFTGDVDALRRAVTAHRAALRDEPDNPRRRSNLGLCLTRWFEQTDDLDHLAEAVDLLRTSAAATSPDHPKHASYQSNLGLALTRWCERTGERASAEESLAAHTAAVHTVRGTPATAAAMLANLGTARMVAFRCTGEKQLLGEAVEAFRDAVRLVPDEHPHAAGCAAGLGYALSAAAVAAGDTALLVEAIRVLRTVVGDVPAEEPDGPLYRSQLAEALRVSYAWTGDTVALEESIARRREAIMFLPAAHPDRLRFRADLALALRNRFEHQPEPAALHEARDLLHEVVRDAPGDHPERVKWLADLANVLHRLGTHERDAEVLAEAADLLRQAAATVDPAHPDRFMHLANLGAVLVSALDLEWSPATYTDAVAALSQAARHPAVAADASLNLGLAHLARIGHGDPEQPRLAAIDAFTVAAEAPTASARMGTTAAVHLGRLHLLANDPAAALTAFTTALERLDLVAWRGLHRDDQERQLVEFSGLGRDAAACAIAVGDPDRALAVSEQGRGVLLGQILDVRGDDETLRRESPDLADELRDLHDAIDSATGSLTDRSPATGAVLDRQPLVVRRDEVLARIRSRPGLKRFLLAPDVAALRPAASAGPIVTVNVTDQRCDALSTTTASTLVVPLPDLTAEAATRYANTFVAAVNANTWGTNETIRDTLAWLWDTITAPVLDHLDLLGAARAPLPYLWWVPTGPLSVLPLHAAGHHGSRDGDDQSALHRVASSYAPSLRLLAHVQHQRPSDGPPALVVAVDSPSDRLASVRTEAEAVAAALTAPVVRLSDGDATRARVVHSLTGSGRAHFACHARTDPASPSDSRLDLADGPLRIRDIAALRVPRGNLAYLSACTTALGSGRLPDETIHLSSAFQVAGFPTVIGTLWRVPDKPTAEMATAIYAALATHTPARAVNLAARQARDRYRDNPYEWAAFVHSGPEKEPAGDRPRPPATGRKSTDR